jgi:hypothetical protein
MYERYRQNDDRDAKARRATDPDRREPFVLTHDEFDRMRNGPINPASILFATAETHFYGARSRGITDDEQAAVDTCHDVRPDAGDYLGNA